MSLSPRKVLLIPPPPQLLKLGVEFALETVDDTVADHGEEFEAVAGSGGREEEGWVF